MTDFNPITLLAAVREEQTKQANAESAALKRVMAWDRAMNRAFKGIVSRPQRHRYLMRATEGK